MAYDRPGVAGAVPRPAHHPTSHSAARAGSPSALDMFAATAARACRQAAASTTSARRSPSAEVDRMSDALAAGAAAPTASPARRPPRRLPAEHPAVRDRRAGDVEGGRHRRADQPDEQGARAHLRHRGLGRQRCSSRWSRCTPTSSASRELPRPCAVITTSELDLTDRRPAAQRVRGVDAQPLGRDRSTCSSSIAAHDGEEPPADRAGPGRRRLPHLHVGHHGAAEGRDEHPRQRRVQLRGLPASGCS